MATLTNIGATLRKGLRLKETPQTFTNIDRARKALQRKGAYLLQLPTGDYAVCKNDATCDRLSMMADALLLCIAQGGKIYNV